MFTGIVTEMGRVAAVVTEGDVTRLSVEAPETAVGLTVGDSVSVAGVCLTVVDLSGVGFSVEMVGETMARTGLGGLEVGDPVNLECPMAASGRFDGHIVQGHVDGVGTVEVATGSDGDRLVVVRVPEELRRYLVEKGSITVDGVSLTIASLTDHGFAVALIPHTTEVTTLGRLEAGDRVNVEVDVIAKYVERLLGARG